MFGEQVRMLRTAKSMSQVEMAKALGVTKQSVSNWENENIMPSVDMLVKISTLFGVTTDYLLGLSDRRTLSVDGLSETQIAHVQMVVDDIRHGGGQNPSSLPLTSS